ncbi:CDP-alcohol phosphatidyltransferase family protein [Cyclobacteriaceae bacterium]|nr:CDP-alcohol phosphatidyltransferase family protein [Cyclobacteriaceae bacterium]
MKKISEYREICQKKQISNEGESGVKLFFRLISIYFTVGFIYLRIKPNNVTLLSIFIGFLSAISYYQGLLNLGSLFLLISITLDFCDGEVARYFNAGSLEGQYLDLILHWVLHPVIICSITLHLYNQDNSDTLILVMGFISAISSVLISLVRTYAKYIIFWLNNKEAIKRDDKKTNYSQKSYFLKLLSKITEFYDFPFIMLIFIAFSYLNLLYDIELLRPLIIFLGVTFPLIISGFIFSNVKNKRLTVQ